nr:TonB-dependent hemoglobin/transferrin/lactoferrin family receptor [uncultured Cohaesibacter sp.]
MNTHAMRLAMFRAGTAMIAVCLYTAAEAQDSPKETVVTTLDEITVTASKGEGAAIDELASVSVVDEATKEQTGANTVLELLRAVPGLSTTMVSGDTAASVNIRGMEGYGRVAVTVDGARQNYQQSSHGLTSGSFIVEPEFLQGATVIKGPSANAYGSGAIGGVVGFRTKNPSDFLEEDETWAAETMLRYSTNNGWAAGQTASARVNDAFSVLGSVIYRDNDVYKDGDGNKVANSDSQIVRGMIKAEIELSEEQKLVLGYIRNHDESGSSSYDNVVETNNLTAQYSYASLDNDLIDLKLNGYWTSTDLEQTYLTNATYKGQTRTFSIDTIGAGVVNNSLFSTNALEHKLTYGVDGYLDTVDNSDPAYSGGDGATPSGERSVYGAFLQDTISFDDWLEVTGGLRYDAYNLDGNGVDNSGDHLSPKVTVGVSPFSSGALDGLQIYGSYAEAFRAPALTETLVSWSHSGMFAMIPNADLKPETSRNFEAGLNYKVDSIFSDTDGLRLKAAAFQNNVSDYIEQIGIGTPTSFYGTTIYPEYQYQNINDARIEGFEIEASYDAGWIYGNFTGTIQKGYNETEGGYLDSVPANKFVTTVGFRALEDKADFGVQWESIKAQENTDSSDYDLVNLFASYEPRKGTSLSVNVDNLLDETYKPYGFTDNSRGRTIMFTLTQRFGG